MANGHGGARIGAGKKKKPLADKILEGNPGKRKLTVLEFAEPADLTGEDMPPAREYLAAVQKNGKALIGTEIYETTWQWLSERGCAALIPTQLIEQYAMAVSRWMQCEEAITEYGFLAKHPTTGQAMQSPYVAMSQSFGKQANNLWCVTGTVGSAAAITGLTLPGCIAVLSDGAHAFRKETAKRTAQIIRVFFK